MDPDHRKNRGVSIHIHVNASQENEIGTVKIGGGNLERHVKISPGDVHGITVDSRKRCEPYKNRWRDLDICADLQAFSLQRGRYRSPRIWKKKVPQPSAAEPEQQVVADLCG